MSRFCIIVWMAIIVICGFFSAAIWTSESTLAQKFVFTGLLGLFQMIVLMYAYVNFRDL